MMVLLFVRQEYAFDRFHEDGERIYRLLSEDSLGTGLHRSSVQIGHLAPRLADAVPAIDGVARMHRRGGTFVVDGEPFRVNDYYWGDPAFFDLFDFHLTEGDEAQALSTPGSLVVSAALAQRLFGQTDVLGHLVRVDNEHDMVVTGILSAPRGPSHLSIEAIGSMGTLGEIENFWDHQNQGWTYVRLTDGTDPKEVEADVNGRLESFVTWMNLDTYHLRLRLQPLSQIRLHSADVAAPGNVGDVRQVRLFSLVGILILLLACANFTNMAMARSVQRMREVGMRKTLGANRRQIVQQFMVEAFVSTLICLVLALILVESLLPWFKSLIGQSVPGVLDGSRDVLAWILGIALLASVLAGLIPAMQMSRFQPVDALKGGKGGRIRSRTREVLVVGQFVVSTMLIFASLGIHAQMQHIRDQNPGFRTEHVVQLSNAGASVIPATLINALSGVSQVVSVSHSSGIPIGGGMVSDMHVEDRKTMSKRLVVDEHYARTLDLELAEGRWMNPPFASDEVAEFVVNEAYVRFMGWENPLERTLSSGYNDETGEWHQRPIVGVVKDFHTGSAREAIIPVVLDARPSMERFRFVYLVRIAPGDPVVAMDGIKKVWAQLAPDRPFSATFADDTIQAMYESENRMARLFNVFTGLAIGIACLGLFGLAALTTELRTKEIGIRRVLGATTTRIVGTLSIDFIRLVVLAVVIALPIGWFSLQSWLDGFTLRIEPGWALPLVVALAVTGLAWLTVAGQAWNAARHRPVDSLRSE